MKETWVRSPVWEGFPCQRATKPVHYNYYKQLKFVHPRTCALQEKSQQWEAWAQKQVPEQHKQSKQNPTTWYHNLVIWFKFYKVFIVRISFPLQELKTQNNRRSKKIEIHYLLIKCKQYITMGVPWWRFQSLLLTASLRQLLFQPLHRHS